MALLTVSGAGAGSVGKGSGANGSSTEAANTLRSDVLVNLIEALGEGPIVGLVNGANSIYIDNTPLANVDGTRNFVGIEWDQRLGLPEQAPLPGPNQTSTQYDVNVQVLASAPIVRTISDPSTNAVQVIMNFPALALENQVTGDITGTSIAYNVDQRASGGDWVTIFAVQLNNQKCTSPYQKAHVVLSPPGTDPWDLRIVRLTADADPVESQFLQNQTWWQSYATITAGSYTYDDTAVVSIYVDAFLFGSNLGTRAYHVRGLLIDVPSNYDPIAKTYSGIWDGTFKSAWSSNPAWVFWDIVTNTRYGIGEFVDPTLVDKWSLYQIAQYCDQLVPSGFFDFNGNPVMEPRYAFNGVINTREEAYKILQNITTAFRGMAFWSLGQAFCAADMPSDPVVGLTPANVIGGHFKYAGTAMKARHSVAVCWWNDPLQMFTSVPEIVQSDAQIQQFGWRQKDVTLYGCTSRGQAHRFGKWILDTEENSTETVQFSMSWDGYVLQNNVSIKPGDIIMITDPRKNGNYRAGGRLAESPLTTTSVLVLDQPFMHQTDQTYTLSCLLPDGSFETRPIASFASDNVTVTLSTPFSLVPVIAADWIVQSNEMAARQFTVLAVQEDGENIFKITALFFDPTKFARVEGGIQLNPIQYVAPRNVISAPTNITATDVNFFQNGGATSRVTLSWTAPNDFMVSLFTVTGNGPNGFASFPPTSQPTIDIYNLAPGAWTFYVAAQSQTGLTSPATPFAFTVAGWAAVSGPLPTSLQVQGGGTVFSGKSATITWINTFPANYVVYSPTNVVRVYDTFNNLLRTEIVNQPSYTYDYDKNVNDGGPRRSVIITVTAQNQTGIESLPASITVSNPVPALVVPTVIGDVGFLTVSYQPVDNDYAGALVWISQDGGFVPTIGSAPNPNYNGPDTSTVLAVAGGTWYVFVAIYDAFGQVGLNVSAPVSIVITALTDVLNAVLPDLQAVQSKLSITDAEDISDSVAAILTQITQDRDNLAILTSQIQQTLSIKNDATNLTVGNVSASLSEEQYLRIGADAAEATARLALAATVASNDSTQSANLTTEQTTRASADAAEALSRLALASTVASNASTAAANLTTEASTRATADTANATAISALSSTVTTNAGVTASNLAAEATTRATADTANTALITALTSTVTTNAGVAAANLSTEASTRATADTATAASITALTSTINSNTAAIGTNATTAANATAAVASTVSTLSTTVGSNTANISTVTSSVNGVKVQYGVIGTIDGVTGGYILSGVQKLDGSVSYSMEISGNLIVSGSISAAKLSVTNLSAISANMGTITTGLIQSTSGNFRIDATNERIEIWSP